MKKSLEELRRELNANSHNAEELCRGLSEEQLSWRPEPGRWSIAELLVHLNLTNQTYVPAIEVAVREGRSRGLTAPAQPFELGFVGAQFARSMEPQRMKMSAPKMICPLLQGPAVEALPQFLRSQDLVVRAMDASDGLDLASVKFTSPFFKLLRLSAIAGFAVIAAHERRHLWQAEQILPLLESKRNPQAS
jgi:hypothetical protein